MNSTHSANSEPPEAEGAMTLLVIREHIVSTTDTCGGKPRIAGTRIQVRDVAVMYERMKMTPEQIVSEYPHLTLADIHAALAYYHDHREAVNLEIKANSQWYAAMKAEAPSLVLDKLKGRQAHATDGPLPPR